MGDTDLNVSRTGAILSRQLETLAGRTYNTTRLMIRHGGAHVWASRTVYKSGRVVYAVTWAVEGTWGKRKKSLRILRVEGVTLKQALFYRDETMRELNMHYALVAFSKIVNDTYYVNTNTMVDAEGYVEDEDETAAFHAMYGYGLPHPERYAPKGL